MDLNKQRHVIQNGFKKTPIFSAATKENSGIKNYGIEQVKKYSSVFLENKNLSYSHFIPASGAASRMFKDLILFYNNFENSNLSFEKFIDQNQLNKVLLFFKEFKNFAFYPELVINHPEIVRYLEKNDYQNILKLIFSEPILIHKTPKGLLPFHLYEDGFKTAFEEHLLEAIDINFSNNKSVKLTFTVSEEHINKFQNSFENLKSKFEDKFQKNIDVKFVLQDPKTNSFCFNNDFSEVLEDEKPLRRPSGHGALIKNLNEIKEDFVFIKNIDNVSKGLDKSFNSSYQRFLTGLLFEIREKTFSYIQSIKKGDFLQEEITDFCENFLGTKLKSSNVSSDELIKTLNRPIRVCGMVKNEGKAGGGPFWVDFDNILSLQIVELSQIDLSIPENEKIVSKATHFNPVDMVCSLNNFEGDSFDLNEYIHHDFGMVVNKTHNGQPIKYIEKPGLWNGSMGEWNTHFVEIPAELFNPVKSVTDLLGKGHF